MVVSAQLTMTVVIVSRKPPSGVTFLKKKKKVATNREAIAALCSKATDWLKQ